MEIIVFILDRRVIIYGIGIRYDSLVRRQENVGVAFLKNRIEVIGFADGNDDLIGKNVVYEGQLFKIKNVYEFDRNTFDKIIVTTKKYFKEIKSQMIQNGLEEEQILLIDDMFELNPEYVSYEYISYLEKQWIKLCKMKKNVGDFLRDRKYKKVAVYGDGIFAERLLKELRQSNLENQHWRYSKIEKQESDNSSVDIIVVASSENYMDTERRLCETNNIEVISIQELIYKSIKYFSREIDICEI